MCTRVFNWGCNYDNEIFYKSIANRENEGDWLCHSTFIFYGRVYIGQYLLVYAFPLLGGITTVTISQYGVGVLYLQMYSVFTEQKNERSEVMIINKLMKKGLMLTTFTGYGTLALADSGGSSITSALQWLIDFVGGPFGAAIATLSIMTCGVLLWMNKLEKETFVKVLVGGGIVFGAAAIMKAIGWGG